MLSGERALVVVLSFEGPDQYSQAGGLGTRVKELTRALAERGFETHLYFVGDPDLPPHETLADGRLHLHRWGQWISAHHRAGVYEGEEGKVADWNASLPAHLVETVIAPAVAAEKLVVVLAEEWHTARSVVLLAQLLSFHRCRDRVVMLWNANNVFGFDRIGWAGLQRASTITTVSRYMKHRMWESGINPITIPNGIPAAAISDPPLRAVASLRKAAGTDVFCFKIGRFDPDKRWVMAVTAMALLKREGLTVRLLMRGGSEPHGREVLAQAAALGLTVKDVRSPADAAGLRRLLVLHRQADILNLTSLLPDSLLGTIYAAADAVLANSGHEPFGLVGLEVMAAGGLAVTGSTGEDYASAFRNAIVLETDDPMELAEGIRLIRERPALAAEIRQRGRETAREYVWDTVIDELLLRLELAAGQQGVDPAAFR